MTFVKGQPRPAGAGRKKGVKYKTMGVDEVRTIIQANGEQLCTELLRLAAQAKHEPTRIAAIKEAMERAYGKPVQPIEGHISHSYEVTLGFGQPADPTHESQHGLSDTVQGLAVNGKALVYSGGS